MTYRDNGMTTIEVKIFLTFLIPYMTSLAMINCYIEKWINVKEFHLLFIVFSKFILIASKTDEKPILRNGLTTDL